MLIALVAIIIIALTCVVLYLLFSSGNKVTKKITQTTTTGTTGTMGTTTVAVSTSETVRFYWSYFWWKRVFWTVVFVAVILAFLPQIVGFGGWVLAHIIAGPDQVFRGTPRSHWTGTPSTEIRLPQGKSVGGPLRWNEEANVGLRPRMNRETLDENGICFAGVIPPASWMDLEITAYHESTNPWKAVLLDYGYTGRFLSQGLMQQHAVSEKDIPSGVLDLFDLPTKGKHAARITDRSVPESEVSRGFKVSDWYAQVSPGGPKEVVIQLLEEPADTFQYIVEVGTNESSFTIPHQNWRWLWIVPIHHEAYEASLDGMSVPAEGITTERFRNHLGIEITVNGEKRVLDKALLLQQTDCRSSTIDLSLNTNGVLTPEGSVKPAKIIVGIQM